MKIHILMTILVTSVACTNKSETSPVGGKPSGTKVFYHSEDGNPTSLDPTQSATYYTNIMVSSIYHTLYEYKYLKKPYELKPFLAESMPQVSSDNLTFTIKLKKGIFFVDDPAFPEGKGREVLASDFVYSLKRHFDPTTRSQGAWLWEGKVKGLDAWKEKGSDYSKEVEGLKAIDSHTVQISLTKPFPQLLYTLAMPYSSVVPKEAVDKYGKEFGIRPVGSGVWKMVSSFDTNKIILERNEKLPKERFDAKAEGYDEAVHGFTGIKELDGKEYPFVDRVVVTFIKEKVPRWNSFTKGNEIQYTALPIEMQDLVLESKNPVKLKSEFANKYHFMASPEFAFVYQNFNMDNPEIGYNKDKQREERNKALRCAIRKAFDWRERIDKFYFGIGDPFPGIIPPSVDGFDPSISKDSVTFDMEGAKKLLADHGWNASNIPVIELHASKSVRDDQMFEQERALFQKLGIPANKIRHVTYANFGDLNKAVIEKKVMIYGMAWGLDYPDAENTLALFYGPNHSPGSNGANFANAEYDELYRKSSVMMPGPERSKIYSRMNNIVIDECVTISGFSRTHVFMWHKNVIMLPERDVLSNYYKYVDVK